MSGWSPFIPLGTRPFRYRPNRNPAFLARVQANEAAQAAFERDRSGPGVAESIAEARWRRVYAAELERLERKEREER